MPATIALAGEIDISDVYDIAERVGYALAKTPSMLTIDLTAVTFMDSSGLGALVHARNECEARGVSFCLLAPSERVVRLLEITGLESLFAIQPGARRGGGPAAPAHGA